MPRVLRRYLSTHGSSFSLKGLCSRLSYHTYERGRARKCPSRTVPRKVTDLFVHSSARSPSPGSSAQYVTIFFVEKLRHAEQEELVRTLSQTNHDVLPALLEPSSVLEFNAQIYSQVRRSPAVFECHLCACRAVPCRACPGRHDEQPIVYVLCLGWTVEYTWN